MPRDELADLLWGDTLPATWDKALSVLVSKLRALLTSAGLNGSHALTGAFSCYRLELPEDTWVDVRAAARGADEAEQVLVRGDLATAKAAAAEAESLSRQPFLPGDNGAWVDDKRRELADVRWRAVRTLAEACLGLGDAAEAASWAGQAIALEPFRETGYRLLMEAHAAAGNRAEALRVYERCRRLLADELGAYPSPETDSIYRRLLQIPTASEKRAATAASRQAPLGAAPGQEAEPAPPLENVVPSSPHRSAVRRRIAAVAVPAALVAAVTTAVAVSGREHGRVEVTADSVVALNPSGSIAATVAVGARPVAITSVAGSLWVANLDDRSVTRIDLSSHQVLRSIPTSGAPTALTSARGEVWVSAGTGQISQIDPEYNAATPIRRLVTTFPTSDDTAWPVLAAFGSVWVVDPDGYVTRLDARSGRRQALVEIGNDPTAITAGAGSVWVTNSADGTVTRIDPATTVATTIPVGHGPAAIAVNAAGAWVANAGTNTLVRVDPHTNAVAATTRVGDGPMSLVATPDALWVANGGDGTVMRLDPNSGKVTRTIDLGGSPNAFAYAAGRIWVTLAPPPPPLPRAGGIARVTVQDNLPSLDPAIGVQNATAVSILYATCANLVTYPDKPAPGGSHIVPEVAEAVPTPTDGGRTYTFTIRAGYRFSPPSNEPVTAQTFKSTIERIANPRLRSPLASAFSDIVGYHAYASGRADGLAGVVAHGSTLTIRLTRPNGAFLTELAYSAACAVPIGTPAVPGGLTQVPSAGPYYVASYTPRQQMVLRRNPNYHGERPHHLDQIAFTIGVDSSLALAEIEAGKADYALDGLPRDAGPQLQARYGPGSTAAKQRHQQYFINPANGMRWLHMNTSRPLFANVRLRRAVNYAIDRSALVAQGRRFTEDNPFNAGQPTDDYMPPAVTGAPDLHLYPASRPDLHLAKRLAGHLQATAIMYTPNVPPWLQEAQIIRSDLRPLGIDVQVKQFPIGDFFARIGRRDEPFDLAVSGWGGASTDPADVLDLFDGTTIHATDNKDLSYFDNPGFDRQLHAAAALSGPRRYRTYAQLELELERNYAPVAAFATNASRDLFSARIGCQTYQPVYGMDLAALCLRR